MSPPPCSWKLGLSRTGHHIHWIRYSVHGEDFRESSGSERENHAVKLLKLRWQESAAALFTGPAQDRVMMDDLLAALETDYERISGARSPR